MFMWVKIVSIVISILIIIAGILVIVFKHVNQQNAIHNQKCNISGYKVVRVENQGVWCMTGFKLD